jgi:hypothetical protein
MVRQRNRGKREERVGKLDEFPEEFDNTFFVNHLVDSDSKIPVLRNVVYRKIKDAIVDRSAEWKSADDVPLKDEFLVSFTTEGFSQFQWGIVKDELLDCGFDARFEFETVEGKERATKMIVKVELDVDLHETIEDREAEEWEEDEDEESEDE